MHYLASINDFFKAPAWRNNLLLGAVAMLIPIIGPIVLLGWHVSCLWLPGRSGQPEHYPPFDFNQAFGKYLERGLWPFLVGLVVSIAMIPLFLAAGGVFLILFGGWAHACPPGDSGILLAGFMVGTLVLDFALVALLQCVSSPLVIRATLTQDFKPSFDMGFFRSFLRLVWRELLVSLLFLAGLGVCSLVLAIVTCYVGAILAMPVLSFSWHHLQRQIYQIYLARGGPPVPPSPRLCDHPPPLPAPVPPPPLPSGS